MSKRLDVNNWTDAQRVGWQLGVENCDSYTLVSVLERAGWAPGSKDFREGLRFAEWARLVYHRLSGEKSHVEA